MKRDELIGFRAWRPAVLLALGLAATPAHAHGIPVWMFVAALSPLPVLILVAVYGALARNWRAALVHATVLAFWVAGFWLASNYHEVRLLGLPTDYVIWAAMAVYAMHALLIVALVIQQAVRRLAARKTARWT